MKAVTVNRKTWHYKVAKFWCSVHQDMPQEFCTYVRYVVFGLIELIAVLIGVALLFGAVLSVPVFITYHIGNYLITGDSANQAFGASIALVLILAAVLFKIITKRWDDEAAGLRPVAKKAESVYAAAWEQWRSKVCWRVNYDQ